jgi:hypothetical protein
MRIDTGALGWLVLGLTTSCGRPDPAPAVTPDPPPHPASAAATPAPPPASAAAGPFDARLLEVARAYRGWSKVASDLAWAVADCDSDALPMDPPLRASASEDAATHGQKLYYLFARDRPAYAPPRGERAKAGQVLVKEAWTSIPVPPGEAPAIGAMAEHGGRRYRTGTRAGLFVMMKLDPTTAGTDEGWVYGVLSGDGARVVAAGRVEECMRCHVHAPYDRLYGPSSEAQRGR